MSTTGTTLLWVVLTPFVGSFILGLLALSGVSAAKKFAGWLASAVIFVSFWNASRMAYEFLSIADRPNVLAKLGHWIEVGNLSISAHFSMDLLSSVLCLVVSGVSLLIHVYSIGYMAHDPGRTRYFSYLNLFCGFMLVLLTGANLPLLFIGWEGVGLCSFLLIGFWYSDRANSLAGKKAFIVNRIGDAAFLAGMFLTFHTFGTLEFSELSAHKLLHSFAGTGRLELIAILFFIGCVGKSAQFPLYIWLPDAMAGPTPVSALIHAATMVTAGVYLMGRMFFLYGLTPMASDLIAGIGGFTALFAATIAITQSDIKKVLAFSTVSQLGYMVLAMGIGAYSAGIFHLITHAYFKALLFLAAGSVIHALHGEQDIHKMGGLKTNIHYTTMVFAGGYIGITGVLPFVSSGWYSKDEILYQAMASGHMVLFWIGVVGALLTTLYMTRLFCLVFLGLPRTNKQKLASVHESPGTMLTPMAILAGLSVLGGLPFLSFQKTLMKVFPGMEVGGHSAHLFTHGQLGTVLTISSIVVAFLVFKLYTAWKPSTERFAKRFGNISRWMQRQYRFDDLMVSVGKRSTAFLSQTSNLFDVKVIDWTVNFFGSSMRSVGESLSRVQMGFVQWYAFMILVGSMVIIWVLLGVN